MSCSLTGDRAIITAKAKKDPMPNQMLAIVKDGKIEPIEPVNFPEGSELVVILNSPNSDDRDEPGYDVSQIEYPEDRYRSIDRLANPNRSTSPENPWLAIAGSLADDPFFDDYIAEIERYRREIDRETSETENDRTA
jgi:hypothetical protein